MPKLKPVYNIILLGDPAAGKATQAAFLVKKYNLFDFDMGKELSRLRSKDKQIDSLLKTNNDKGKLTPTAVVRKILRDTIAKIPSSSGILFDGHPKMLGEAKLVRQLMVKNKRTSPLIIYLTIPLEETVRRIKSRKGYFNGKFGKRADDNSQALRNRAKYYRTNISQVIDYFKQTHKFIKISGLGSRSSVETRLNKEIKQWEKDVLNV